MTAARFDAAKESDPEESRTILVMATLDERERELRALGMDWEEASLQSQYECDHG